MEQIFDIQLSHLHCQQNNLAKLVCCSQKCIKCALICRKQNCKCLPQNHYNCQYIYLQTIINKIMNKRQKVSTELMNGFKQIQKLYDCAIEQLSKDKQQLIQWKDNYGLTSQQALLINSVVQNNYNNIVGDLIYKVKKGFINYQQINKLSWLNQKRVQQFWQLESPKFQSLKRKIMSLYKPGKYGKFQIDFKVSHCQYFKINEETNIIQKIKKDGQFHNIVSKNQIPKKGKTVYQIQLIKCKNRAVMFGIVTMAGKQLLSLHSNRQGILYNNYNGNVYENGGQRKLLKSTNQQQKIRMEIDMKINQISWYANNRMLGSTQISEKFRKEKIFPVIEIPWIHDTIKIKQ